MRSTTSGQAGSELFAKASHTSRNSKLSGSFLARGGASFRLGIDGRVLDDRYHGIGRVTGSLLRGLAGRSEVDVVVFLLPGQQSRRFDVAGLTSGLGHEVVELPAPLGSVRQGFLWPRVARAARVDSVVFPYHLGAALTGTGTADRYAMVHDCILESDPAFAPGSLTRAVYRMATRAVLAGNSVITPSAASAEEIRRFYGLPRHGVTVLPWGVDPEFGVDPGARSARRPAGVPGRYLLHVGARRPHKNVVTLVRALADLPLDVHLVLVGSVDGRMPDPVPEVARELGVAGRITAFDHVPEDRLIALYRSAHAFVYPSLVEGFGLPLLEAMAAGTPVVASDIAVFREFGAGAATFAPPRDPQAWARAVRNLDDPGFRSRSTAAGLELARAATWERAVDAFVAAVRPAHLRASGPA
jgi:glycosyltransferase involved in cell wall biosynthesis